MTVTESHSVFRAMSLKSCNAVLTTETHYRLKRGGDCPTVIMTTLQGATKLMEIQNMLSSPIYAETLSKLRSKAKGNAKQSFTDFI